MNKDGNGTGDATVRERDVKSFCARSTGGGRGAVATLILDHIFVSLKAWQDTVAAAASTPWVKSSTATVLLQGAGAVGKRDEQERKHRVHVLQLHHRALLLPPAAIIIRRNR
jgi:hypothetical protein